MPVIATIEIHYKQALYTRVSALLIGRDRSFVSLPISNHAYTNACYLSLSIPLSTSLSLYLTLSNYLTHSHKNDRKDK